MDKEWNEKYSQQDLQRLRGFRLMDDDFKVEKIETQHLIKNLQGRSIILDIYATDHVGKQYNIEIQRADRGGGGGKRARYHSSLIDVNVTEPGDKLENLAETYVIFITERDVMGDGLPIYHINRVVEETGKKFQDEAHIIYVNGAYRDQSPLGILMHDFSCTDPNDITYEVLAERVRYFKEDAEGVAAMCKAMEDMRNEAVMDERKDVACRLLKMGGMALDKIAEISKLSIEEVRMLASQKNA